MKTCSTCGDSKDLSEFQTRKASKDGLTSSCKSCLKARDSARYEKERDIRLSRMKSYVATPEGRDAHIRAVAAWRDRNKLRYAAHIILNNAIKAGSVIPWPVCALPDCASKPEAHHPDYNNPLDVVWLCSKHHKETHALVKEIKEKA